jgi:hypothetical protein
MSSVIAAYFDDFPNRFGDIYTMIRKSDNTFHLSYHLNFLKQNIQFNFWLEKSSYLNANEYVTISVYNGKEQFEKDKLKTILVTKNFKELKNKVEEIIKQYS